MFFLFVFNVIAFYAFGKLYGGSETLRTWRGHNLFDLNFGTRLLQALGVIVYSTPQWSRLAPSEFPHVQSVSMFYERMRWPKDHTHLACFWSQLIQILSLFVLNGAIWMSVCTSHSTATSEHSYMLVPIMFCLSGCASHPTAQNNVLCKTVTRHFVFTKNGCATCFATYCVDHCPMKWSRGPTYPTFSKRFFVMVACVVVKVS